MTKPKQIKAGEAVGSATGQRMGETPPAALRPVPIPQARRKFDFGEAVPTFHAPALSGNPAYAFDSAAGRLIVLLFVGSGGWQPGKDALALLARHAQLFDDENAAFFGVTIDPTDAAKGRIAQRIPGIRWFLDYDAAVSRFYGAATGQGGEAGYAPFWLLLDSTMRVIAQAPLSQGERIFAVLRTMIGAGPEQMTAPVLTVPRVFEPELCRELIRLYDAKGGEDSGFMRTRDGKTIAVFDHSFKRRSDYVIEDTALKSLLLDRIVRRLTPQIERAFRYRPTRIERWMIACYDGESGGFFRPHRDNTTAGTAHRVFACTINLNSEEYDGGELRFPEYGQRTYRAPTGGAVVFSCELLHEAMRVTRGRRYAFLPFFYDEAMARLRERNQQHIASGHNGYRASPDEAPAGLAPKETPEP